MSEYISRVIAEYNTWAKRLAEARVPGGGLENQGVASFMCNAISNQVRGSNVAEFNERFYEESMHESMSVSYMTVKVEGGYEAQVYLPPPQEKGRPKGEWLWVRTEVWSTLGEAHDAARDLIHRVSQ